MKTKISIITVTRSRPQLLARAIASLKVQSSQNFEWIVINDGEDAATKQSVRNADICFPHTYVSMPHPDCGFALGGNAEFGQNSTLRLKAFD